MEASRSTTDAERRALDTYVKLVRAAAAVEATVHRPLAEAGLTISQFGVLEALLHLGPMSQGALARKILKSPANLTTVLDNLGRRSLIHRRRDDDDRRVVLVQLTDAGETLVATIFPQHARRVAKAFGTLNLAEQDTLAQLCRELGLAQADHGSQHGREPSAAQPVREPSAAQPVMVDPGTPDPTTPYDPARATDAASVQAGVQAAVQAAVKAAVKEEYP